MCPIVTPICDNKGGIAMVISHLVEEHHLSRILFMAGPEHNTDAIERKEAYLETMKKYGLPVTHGMIAQGGLFRVCGQTGGIPSG